VRDRAQRAAPKIQLVVALLLVPAVLLLVSGWVLMTVAMMGPATVPWLRRLGERPEGPHPVLGHRHRSAPQPGEVVARHRLHDQRLRPGRDRPRDERQPGGVLAQLGQRPPHRVHLAHPALRGRARRRAVRWTVIAAVTLFVAVVIGLFAGAVRISPVGIIGWMFGGGSLTEQQKAIVALARRLAVIMHRMWSDGTEFRWTREATPAAQ